MLIKSKGRLFTPGFNTLLLKTGQTTQYASMPDDGSLQKGVAKSYTIVTHTPSTFNIDLAHYTAVAGHITFNNTAHTIADSDSGLALFKTSDVIITNTANNLGPFTITTGNSAATITCTGATFTSETPSGAVTLYKREAHSTTCIIDNKTGLMWIQSLPNKMGLTSAGTLPWTTAAGGYGIFTYAAAANAGAGLAGFTDWRVPNLFELISLFDLENVGAVPNSTAFPTWTTGTVWSSSTCKDDATTAWNSSHPGTNADRIATVGTKTTASYVLLVRG